MANSLPNVPPPANPVFRIGREPNPFALADWKWAAGGRFGGRWDDPSGSFGVPPDKRFRVTYVATTPTGAYGETIGQWSNQGRTPDDWSKGRLFGEATVLTRLPFVDMTSPEITRLLRDLPLVKNTLADLNQGLTELFSSLKLPIAPLQADAHLIVSIFRPVTQEISRYIYDLMDSAGSPRFAGVKYLSHHLPSWECWAVYENRAQVAMLGATPIEDTNVYLLEAADALSISLK